MRHTYECRVRWSDVDAYGHVNNVKYFEYYQEARVAFLLATGAGWATDRSEQFVVARLRVDYHRPILFRPEPFPIESWVTRMGTSSCEVMSRIRDGESVLSDARATLVAFDVGAGRPRPLRDRERAALSSVLGP